MSVDLFQRYFSTTFFQKFRASLYDCFLLFTPVPQFLFLLFLLKSSISKTEDSAIVSAREDGFITDISLNIQVFFKQNHLDYYLWISVHFFKQEQTRGKLFTIKHMQNCLNQVYIIQNLEIQWWKHWQPLEKGLTR